MQIVRKSNSIECAPRPECPTATVLASPLRSSFLVMQLVAPHVYSARRLLTRAFVGIPEIHEYVLRTKMPAQSVE